MKYFFDHETDALSFIVSDMALYDDTEELAPNVLLYVDARRKPLAVDIREASKVMDTSGLIPMDERLISDDELRDRLSASDAGRMAWSAIHARALLSN